MGFVLDIISKSGNSNELQNFAQSFKDVFATKDTHVFITEANTGNLADADYIVAISNAIKRGNSYILCGKYLNDFMFGIKKIQFSDAFIKNLSAYQEQLIEDLRTFKAEAEINMERLTGTKGIPLVYFCEQEDVDIEDDLLVCGKASEARTLMYKAATQLYLRGSDAVNNMPESINSIATKIKESNIGKPIPLLLTEIPYRKAHKLQTETIMADIDAFCKRQRYPCFYTLSNGESDWDANVFVMLHSPEHTCEHTTQMGVKYQCIYDIEQFYASNHYRRMVRSEVEIKDFIPGEIGEELSKHIGQNTLYTILVKGCINGSDIISLRNYSRDLIGNQSFLERLDLSKCSIVSGGKSYYSSITKWATLDCYTQDDVLTKFIFTDFYFREIVLPEQAIQVENHAFFRLPVLETIVLPALILERACVCECSFVKNIVLQNNVKRMSSGAIFRCPNLSSVELNKQQKKLYFTGDSLYTSNKLLLYTSIDSNEYVVPDNTVEIAPSAFFGKSYLKKILLNQGLKKIGDEAFAKTGITVLHLPTTITHIGKQCIPHTLQDLYVFTAEPCPIADGTFLYFNNKTRLHVPKNALENYKKDIRWSCFSDYIEEEYLAVNIGEIHNHVTGSVKGKLTIKQLSKMGMTEVENLYQSVYFGDIHETFKTIFEERKTLFWLLVRRRKLIVSETCITELERLYPKRHKETGLLRRYWSLWSQECLENSNHDSYYDEPSPRDLERDTYYALGGEDYEAFRESGEDWDSFMDGLGF